MLWARCTGEHLGMTSAFDPTRELLFVDDIRASGDDPRRTRRLAAQGQLIRLRRGVYCRSDRWAVAEERMRHVARAVAASRQAVNPFVVAGVSAAAIWGMPLSVPFGDEVIVIDSHRGGGRSEPGVRRVTSGASAAHPVERFGIQVTDVARTALDVARTAPFHFAVGSVDWALWEKNPEAVARPVLEERLSELRPFAHAAHLKRVVDFAVPVSGSFAESAARAVIHELGYEEPVLQLALRDEEGVMYPDFAWPRLRILVEFDGRAKYEDPRFNGGDPVQKLWDERRREARLRKLGWIVIRVEWSDVVNSHRLAALLDGVGLPRRGK
jgi:predicted transcriptional regulator of viral defense system